MLVLVGWRVEYLKGATRSDPDSSCGVEEGWKPKLNSGNHDVCAAETEEITGLQTRPIPPRVLALTLGM